MLTPEQTEIVKNQLIKHVESSFPEDRKEFAINQIKTMDSNQLEGFLKNNNIALEGTGNEINTPQKCIFCSIASGQIESYKIDENIKAIAVLEINPISEGHVLIIPKEHSLEHNKKDSQTIKKFIEKISKKINTKLKPINIVTSSSSLFGHDVINIIPIYTNETIDSERKPADKETLIKLQKKLEFKKRIPTIRKAKVKKIKDEKKLWLPKRIP